MSKKPIEQCIAEALGYEWDGVIYQDDPPTNTEVYDENGKDMTNPMYGMGHLFTGKQNVMYGRKRPDTAQGNKDNKWSLGKNLGASNGIHQVDRTGKNNPMYGVPCSEASKKASSEYQTGRKHSPETIEKMRQTANKAYAAGRKSSNQHTVKK